MDGREYDFWLLDLDGTLVDVEGRYIQEVIRGVCGRFGVSVSEREAETLWYGPSEPRSGVLARHGIEPGPFWDAFHEVEQPQSRAAATHLYDDAETFLASIEAPLGLVTHCQDFLTYPVLDALDIGDRFDTVVCCSDETGWKPDPTPVEFAMRDLDVAGNGHHGVLVGDDPGDVGAAWNAGLAGIHVNRRDPHRVGQCVRGDRRVDSLAELGGS
jgi:phosphoglycolate phosphatase